MRESESESESERENEQEGCRRPDSITKQHTQKKILWYQFQSTERNGRCTAAPCEQNSRQSVSHR